jgi:uncharacterized protein YgiM (DUF1202 family)
MKKILLSLFILLGTSSLMVAGDFGRGDRCDGRGVVRGLDYYGDNFLAVRTGPGSHYRQIDSIYNGDRVRICDWRGGWLNVRYRGGSGWVFGRYVRER